jgi:hypothetical protein
MIRYLLLSNWFAAGLGLLALAIHVGWWFSPAYSRSEVISGFGATLIAFGIMLTARPFTRAGLAATVGQAMPPPSGSFAGGEKSREHNRAREEKRPQVRRDVIVERIVGPSVIVCGTLMNGYASALLRWLGL